MLSDLSSLEARLPKMFAGHPLEFRPTIAAVEIVKTCLGPHAKERVVTDFGEVPTPFGTFNWRSAARLTHMGAYLFGLRTTPAFAEVCRRLAARDMRAAYYELVAADYLRAGGCQVSARPEQGQRGLDFDLTASHGNHEFAVEVTALLPGEFSPRNLRNALIKKRKQLPPKGAGVIFCVLPEQWLQGVIDWMDQLYDPISSFLRGTGRVSAIVLLREDHYPAPTGGSGALAITTMPIFNLAARHDADVSFLKVTPSGDRPAEGHPTGSVAAERIQLSEYVRWVESIPAEGPTAT